MADGEVLPQPDPAVVAAVEGRRVPRPKTAKDPSEESAIALALAKTELDVLVREIDNTNPNRMPIQFFKKEDWHQRASRVRKILDRITL